MVTPGAARGGGLPGCRPVTENKMGEVTAQTPLQGHPRQSPWLPYPAPSWPASFLSQAHPGHTHLMYVSLVLSLAWQGTSIGRGHTSCYHQSPQWLARCFVQVQSPPCAKETLLPFAGQQKRALTLWNQMSSLQLHDGLNDRQDTGGDNFPNHPDSAGGKRQSQGAR